MKITQVAIAKNEENNLENCYGKIANICDYRILIDTGSTDNTVKKAKEMGINVYNFEWIDDFAAAKNFALSKIPDDTDWVIFLDLDESFYDDSIKNLIPMFESANNFKEKFDGILTPIYNVDDDDEIISIIPNVSPRIFRWQKGLSFESSIHESLSLNGGTIIMMPTKPEIRIKHIGYAISQFKGKNKAKRNCDIIKKEIEKNPDDINLIVQYADSALAGGDFYNSKLMYCKATMMIDENTNEFTKNSIFRNLMNIIAREPNDNEKDRIDQFLWTYRYAKNLNPNNPDYDYLLGLFSYSMNMQNTAIIALNTAMTLKENYNGFVETYYNEKKVKEILKSYNAWVE